MPQGSYAYLLGLYLGDGCISRAGDSRKDVWVLRIMRGCVARHGPGRKHERRIELEAWQQVIVAVHAGDFVRGLFHSDGYRGINRGSPGAG